MPCAEPGNTRRAPEPFEITPCPRASDGGRLRPRHDKNSPSRDPACPQPSTPASPCPPPSTSCCRVEPAPHDRTAPCPPPRRPIGRMLSPRLYWTAPGHDALVDHTWADEPQPSSIFTTMRNRSGRARPTEATAHSSIPRAVCRIPVNTEDKVNVKVKDGDKDNFFLARKEASVSSCRGTKPVPSTYPRKQPGREQDGYTRLDKPPAHPRAQVE